MYNICIVFRGNQIRNNEQIGYHVAREIILLDALFGSWVEFYWNQPWIEWGLNLSKFQRIDYSPHVRPNLTNYSIIYRSIYKIT